MPQSSRLDSILEGAEEEILEDVCLQDHLERFLSPRGQLEAKCVDLCRRVEDDAGVNPLRVRNTARTSPAQGLQILIAFSFRRNLGWTVLTMASSTEILFPFSKFSGNSSTSPLFLAYKTLSVHKFTCQGSFNLEMTLFIIKKRPK